MANDDSCVHGGLNNAENLLCVSNIRQSLSFSTGVYLSPFHSFLLLVDFVCPFPELYSTVALHPIADRCYHLQIKILQFVSLGFAFDSTRSTGGQTPCEQARNQSILYVSTLVIAS